MEAISREPAGTEFAKSDQYWRLIVESAGEGIFTVGRDGRFDYVNPRFAQMLEIDEAQLLSRHFSEFLLPEDRDRITARFDGRTRGEPEPRQYELQLQTATGTKFWVEVSLTVLQVGEQFTGTLAFLRDITRRKQAEHNLAELNSRLEQRVQERTYNMWLSNHVLEEQILRARSVTEELRSSEAKWRSLVEHAPQIVMLLDKSGKVMFINHVVEGFDQEQVMKQSILDLVPPQHRDFMQRVLHKVFIQGQRESYEIDGYGANGTTAWYSVAIGPITSTPGEPVDKAVIIAEDITERKAAEDALKTKERDLARVSRVHTMGALTAELAHELNQPLAAISAYADACLRSLSSEETPSERVETALKNVSIQAERAGQIIHRIMDFLRKSDTPRELTNINELIHSVLVFVDDLQGRQHQVSIRCGLQPDLPMIPVNRIQIEQVLCNLLFNAIDALRSVPPESRIIRVTSRQVDMDDVEISVQDEGCGFDPGKAEELFQPFYTTKAQGIGMGLSISRTIIDEHGGRIWATSHPQRGTTFHFQLPQDSDGSDESTIE